MSEPKTSGKNSKNKKEDFVWTRERKVTALRGLCKLRFQMVGDSPEVIGTEILILRLIDELCGDGVTSRCHEEE